MRDLQRDFGTAIVMITHDLGVVAGLCDEVMVLYGGRVMEQGAADSIFYSASHPYTVGLLKAIPRLDADDAALVAIPGAPPNMARPPLGCPFNERCALASAECREKLPALQAAPDHPGVLRAILDEGERRIARGSHRQFIEEDVVEVMIWLQAEKPVLDKNQLCLGWKHLAGR